MAYNYYNQPMMNQLLRYKDSIDNMINQMNTPQPPVQNIINTATSLGTEFEAKILNEDEEVDNILITKRTMFLDKKNKKVVIKELDGKISEEYEIIIPLDEKDKKIMELEKRLKDMEEKINVEYTEPIRSDDEFEVSITNDNESFEPSTTTGDKQSSRSTKREASRSHR